MIINDVVEVYDMSLLAKYFTIEVANYQRNCTLLFLYVHFSDCKTAAIHKVLKRSICSRSTWKNLPSQV